MLNILETTAATYKAKGGLQLIMPQNVRWSALVDCLESYLKHWPILLTICEENKAIIDNNITNIVNNLVVKRSAEELLQMFKPIAVALDLMQGDSCTIGDSVMMWKNLQKELTPKLNQEKSWEAIPVTAMFWQWCATGCH